MTDRPILFSAPMIQALLAGRKTQTRRVLTASNTRWNGGPTDKARFASADFSRAWVDPGPSPAGNPGPYLHVPWQLGEGAAAEELWARVYPVTQPGDRLYVREHWRTSGSLDNLAPVSVPRSAAIIFEADPFPKPSWRGRFRAGMHMPRWASRLTLIVTDVRVQRLQDIPPEDARDEGVDRRSRQVRQIDLFGADQSERDRIYLLACVWEYEDLWNSLNAERGLGWDTNPWVIATTFEVRKSNIDAVGEAP